MFKSDQKNNSNSDPINSAETIIGPSIKVKGNFHGEGDIVIEGEVEGSVKTKNHLLIGGNAKISANISAKTAKIGGKITGNIKVENYLEVGSSAIISGDIQCEEISIEKGAKINGTCSMDKSNNQNLNNEQNLS